MNTLPPQLASRTQREAFRRRFYRSKVFQQSSVAGFCTRLCGSMGISECELLCPLKKNGPPKNCAGSAVSRSCVSLAEHKQVFLRKTSKVPLVSVLLAVRGSRRVSLSPVPSLLANLSILQTTHGGAVPARFSLVRVRLCGQFDPVC